ncbi:hypothetical protein G210_2510 [Candida maltosa Xu316]|uniref:Meiotically up-regulated gene 51 protein n=1 Tax=Candida maltosa (strain Xu316) TaxID=1245528 RepID=M3JXP9_CANMX|nr:hypothetical protein G210_2510 [Candida maltosa Xu316]
MPLQYSPAKSSKVSKKQTNSPVKKFQKDVKKILLPATKLYDGKISKQNPSSPSLITENKLIVKDYNVQLDYQLSSKQDIMIALKLILDNRWSESSKLNNRYPTTETDSVEERIFSLKRLSSDAKVAILKFRKGFPSGLVTVTQLYSIFLNQNNTFVDKSVELGVRQGKLRKFVINNASPVISRSSNKFQSGKVTYGFENVDILVETETYFEMIKSAINASQEDLTATPEQRKLALSSLTNFQNYLNKSPSALYVTGDTFANQDEVSYLVKSGFLTLSSNHLNEIEVSQYAISYPSCGTYLKMINAGRTWLVKLLNKGKFKELLEDQIQSKWEGFTPQGNSKMNNFRAPFFGYDLNWVLADALGAGVIEVFNTPVGRGWRLTGKV